MEQYDFSGWATVNDRKCSDGRTIRQNAFVENDGQTVPLVWNHQHNEASNVLGHALLQNRPEGVYVYGKFNDTESGQNAKKLVMHGDVNALSIYANQLRPKGSPEVMHGNIREVSLVLAGANPGACIDSVLCHSDGDDEEACIYTGEYGEASEGFTLCHAENKTPEKDEGEKAPAPETEPEPKEETKTVKDIKEEPKMANTEKTVQDVFDTLTEEQKTVVYAIIGQALEEAGVNNNEEDDEEMSHNVFDNDEMMGDFLSHADQEEILSLAKSRNVGTLKAALKMFGEDHLEHGFADEDLNTLFPDYELLNPGDPEMVDDDQEWVAAVMNGVKKSPVARVRTRMADISAKELRAKGYKKGAKKENFGNIKLLGRTSDPTTVYVHDEIHRDDIVDITDFDAVAYLFKVMRVLLKEEIATAILINDGREDGDSYKIDDTKIRPIWQDDELYTIHKTVDVAAMKAELQGTDTAKHFGDAFIKTEAMIAAAMEGRVDYKGSGNMTFFCAPNTLNTMLMAKDLNGRRVYKNIEELKAALNAADIQTVEAFTNRTRKYEDPVTHNMVEKKLLGLFVNMRDYQVGCAKKGEIAEFSDFDIDYNKEKLLIETRMSGALIKVKSAIALEEDVTVGE